MAKILIIDDQSIIRKTMKHNLDKQGYDTFVAEDGEKGLDLFHKEKPNIVIVDVMMPGLDGIEVLARVKGISKDVEVIIVSGEGEMDAAIQALRKGAFDYFEKPVNFDKLGISIKSALKKQETQKLLDEYVNKLKKVVAEKAKEINLRKSADKQVHKLFTAVEQSPSPVVITDTDGNIEYVNPKFTLTTGYTAADVIGKKPSILKSGKQSHEVYQKLWATISSGVEWHGELHNKKKSGELYWVSSSISAVKNTDGIITNYINVSEDITRRKLAEDALIEAKDKAEKVSDELQIEITKRKELEQTAKLAAVGKLAAGIAHEINNPLSFIYANLENLNKFSLKVRSLIDVYDELDMPEETRKAIEEKKEEINYTYLKSRIIDMIEKSIDGADRMKKIVMDMKTFSRVDRADVEDANINEAIDATLGIMVHEYKDRIEIKKEYDEQLPTFKCFISKLNQVFLNILANACQAIDGKGVISVRTHRDGDNIVIDIKDSGSGMPDDVMAKIFDPFFTTKPVGQGTGMGLSICHDIIQQHNGELSVESKIGEGTTFTITIPMTS
ncbi:MAG: ATP-binding protein [Candidatus Anammoxibacter sp.]